MSSIILLILYLKTLFIEFLAREFSNQQRQNAIAKISETKEQLDLLLSHLVKVEAEVKMETVGEEIPFADIPHQSYSLSPRTQPRATNSDLQCSSHTTSSAATAQST